MYFLLYIKIYFISKAKSLDLPKRVNSILNVYDLGSGNTDDSLLKCKFHYHTTAKVLIVLDTPESILVEFLVDEK